MEIDKAKVLDLLRQRGLDDRAIWVDKQLPDRIDTYTNAGLLRMLNIDPAELADAAN
jgi:hypothetical protein